MNRQALCNRLELKGISISKGISIGTPYFLCKKKRSIPQKKLTKENISHELSRFRGALNRSKNDLKLLQNRYINDGTSVAVQILDAHLEILHDPYLTNLVEEKIVKTKKNIETVFDEVITDYKEYFKNVEDEFVQERVKDIKDVSLRVLNHLNPISEQSQKKCANGDILLSYELIPSDALDSKYSKAEGFITSIGGYSSHAGIIARAKGLPYVTNIDVDYLEKLTIQTIIIDGINGKIIVNPSEEEKKAYLKKKNDFEKLFKEIENVSLLKTQTKDNLPINIFANVESLEEIDVYDVKNILGIGLFRTEYLLLLEKNILLEECQFQIYKDLLTKMKNKPVTIRLFDVGGDKRHFFLREDQLRYQLGEENPSLGCRGIRFLLKNKDILKTQLRALLRSSIYGNLKILIPLISDLSEFMHVKKIIEEIKRDLLASNHEFLENIPLGCMIEVPSMAYTIENYLPYVDFFSIGTNDLTQYFMAVDRGNSYVDHLYNFANPALVKILKYVLKQAFLAKKEISICGEMASDTNYTKFLIGLGVQNFSVALRHRFLISRAITNIDSRNANEFALDILSKEDQDQIQNLINP